MSSVTEVDEQNLQELTPIQRRRLQDRKEWEAYWEIRRMETADSWTPKLLFNLHKFVDAPVTWYREKIAEPLRDRYRLPYYHRKFTRVPEIDQCGVNDSTCYFEANEQYRRDKMVDNQILKILVDRLDRCITFNGHEELYKCVQSIEDFEEAELNYFIKYGELGSEATVIDAYMKQKHRLIWERRHPEVMAERQRTYEEYLEKKNNGEFDMTFWKKGLPFQDKKRYEVQLGWHKDKPAMEGDKPLSKDWRYYKKLAQDPEFEKDKY